MMIVKPAGQMLSSHPSQHQLVHHTDNVITTDAQTKNSAPFNHCVQLASSHSTLDKTHQQTIPDSTLHQHCLLGCSLGYDSAGFSHSMVRITERHNIILTPLLIAAPQQAWLRDLERPPQIS